MNTRRGIVGALIAASFVTWLPHELGHAQSASEPADRTQDDTVLGALERAQIEAALARYAGEPSVQQLVEAALRVAPRIDTEALADRARSAGWMPRLTLRARRGQALDLRSDQDEDALRVVSNDDLTLEAALSFELDRLVFRPEEVALLRQRRTELDARAALVRQIVHLYYERRRLQVERDLDPEPRIVRSVRIAEIEALFDVFTRGEFRRMIERARWRTAARTNGPRSPSQPKSTARGTR